MTSQRLERYAGARHRHSRLSAEFGARASFIAHPSINWVDADKAGQSRTLPDEKRERLLKTIPCALVFIWQ
jgi:hypothetical protein